MTRRIIAAFLLYLLSNSGWADALPRWEVGAALAGQRLNDYRGSKDEQLRAFPLPFFIYRGDFLKADRGGVRGEFLANDTVELNISGETALSGGSSDDSSLRAGMPELEPAFELGPSLNINLSGESFATGWQLRLPLRLVATVGESGLHQRGYTFNPRFTYTKRKLWRGWRAKLNLGALYGSRSYHDYYYSVDAPYATASREEYSADAGFSGYYFKSTIGRRTKRSIMGFSVRYDNLSDASFRDSPLVETDHYMSVSFFVGWIAWQSK